MQIDLAQILPFLNAYGGWIGTAILMFLRYRNGQPVLPVLPPSPAPAPSPGPTPVAPHPVLDELLGVARKLLSRFEDAPAPRPAGFHTVEK
jgi:hypothetical protein